MKCGQVLGYSITALIALLNTGCNPHSPSPVSAPSASALVTASVSTQGLYTDTAKQAGISFRFSNGATGRHYMIETTGSGCAFFDYDNDGWPDILLLQAGPLPGAAHAGSSTGCHLYHNNSDGTFTDVSALSGLERVGHSQGVAIGDVDGDGYDDVFITGYGGNHLFRNEKGTGRFLDVTERAGLADTRGGQRWCTSAAFGDFNNDSKLDLYVCRYAVWSPKTDKQCKNPRGQSSYCSPELYAPEMHALYRNNGDGTFTDVSKQSGIAASHGHGLGVAWLDFDGDGFEDIFVANDLSPYFLWHNNGNGTFTEVASKAGVAYSDMGSLLSGMGVGVRDFNGDGREDIFVTNFSGQMNVLFRNDGKGAFTNVTTTSGIGPVSMHHLAFGCEFLDFNRDGLPDLIVGNGHVNDDVEAYSQGETYAQSKTLLQNNGDGTFTEVTGGIGDLAVKHVTRGLAIADFDLDGNLDILTNNQDGPPELLRFTGPPKGHWIAIEPRGVRSNTDGYHAKVMVRLGSHMQTAEVRSGSSFGSHSASRVYFGLHDATVIDELKIVWHGSKTVTMARNIAADHVYRAVEGQPVTMFEPKRAKGHAQ